MLETLDQSSDTLNETSPWRLIVDTVGPDQLATRLMALRNLVKGLSAREASRLAEDLERRSKQSTKSNGIKLEDAADGVTSAEDAGTSILTLYGSAQGHKQLFSSLPKAIGTSMERLAARVQAIPPLRDTSLPQGISSTKIYHADSVSRKRPSTFQDLFAPPSSLPQVQPPKPFKGAPNREASVTWSHSSAADQNTRRPRFDQEKLHTGKWLGYSGVGPMDDTPSTEAKRRQRNRALSMSAAEVAQTSTSSASTATQQAKEDALFRCAFSSFAPSKDNSSVLVPEETKSELWWQRYGSGFFNQTFYHHTDFEDVAENGLQENRAAESTDNESALFEKAVIGFDPDLDDNTAGADDLLVEISEMIETLYSFQRIRMSSLQSAPRPGLSYTSAQDSSSAASTPSEEEIETYRMLKHQLAMIIGMLPPYALSKLNGEQLEELRITQQIATEIPDTRGVMAEDPASVIARQQAFQAAVGTTRGQNAASSPAPQAQPRAPQMTQGSRSAVQPPPARPIGGSTFARQHLSNWQTPQQNQNLHMHRPPYANPQTFNQGRPGMNGPVQRPGYPQTVPRAQQQPNGVYPPPAQPNHNQQRPQQSYGSPYVPQAASPARPNQPSGPRFTQGSQQQYGQQPLRPPFMSQGSSGPYQSASPQPRPADILSNGASRPQTPGTPMMPQQSQPPPPMQPQNPGQMPNGRGMSGTPQPLQQSSTPQATPKPSGA